jgi:hypothetical protein
MDNGHTYKMEDGQLQRGSNSWKHRFGRFRKSAEHKQAKNTAVLEHVKTQLKAKFGEGVMTYIGQQHPTATLQNRFQQLAGPHALKGAQLKELSQLAMNQARHMVNAAAAQISAELNNILLMPEMMTPDDVLSAIKNNMPANISQEMREAIMSSALRGLNPPALKATFANFMASQQMADIGNALKFTQSENMQKVLENRAGFMSPQSSTEAQRNMMNAFARVGNDLANIVSAARQAVRLEVPNAPQAPASNATLFTCSQAIREAFTHLGLPNFLQTLRDGMDGYIAVKSAQEFARQASFLDIMTKEFGVIALGNGLAPLKDALIACLNNHQQEIAQLHPPVTPAQLSDNLKAAVGATLRDAIEHNADLKRGIQTICDFFRETVRPSAYQHHNSLNDPFETYMQAALCKVLGSSISAFVMNDPTVPPLQLNILDIVLLTADTFHNTTINSHAQDSMGACLRANIQNFDQIFTAPPQPNINQNHNVNVNVNVNVNNLNPNNQPNIGNNINQGNV